MVYANERMPTPGHNDNALGLIMRIGIPIALLIAAYLVAFCPCDTLLACDSHGPTYFALLGIALSGAAAHMRFGHEGAEK